jgi:hypothetical protein
MAQNIIRFLNIVILVLTVAVITVAYTMRNVAVLPSENENTVYLEGYGNVWEKNIIAPVSD